MISVKYSELLGDLGHYLSKVDSGEIVHFYGILEFESDFKNLGASIGGVLHEGSAEQDGVSRLRVDQAKSQKLNGKGFSTYALFPHTDRSGLPSPPKYLMNLFLRNAGIGGKATLCKVERVIDYLSDNRPSAIDALKDPTTVFSRKGNLLQAPMLDFGPNGDFVFRFRKDDGIRIHPELFADYIFTCEVIEKLTERTSFEAGSGYLINNLNTLHGRTSFIGEREVWRILATGREAND